MSTDIKSFGLAIPFVVDTSTYICTVITSITKVSKHYSLEKGSFLDQYDQFCFTRSSKFSTRFGKRVTPNSLSDCANSVLQVLYEVWRFKKINLVHGSFIVTASGNR